MKKIVTHINPDLDAVASAWLIKRFLPGWEKAEVDFCPPQSTVDGEPVDSNPEIIHVDVGMGKLDHHQTDEFTCAAQLCFDFIKAEKKGEPLKLLVEKALEEMVMVVNEIDHARDLAWPEIKTSRYNFYLSEIIAGIRGVSEDDQETMARGLQALDAVLHRTKKRIDAQEEIERGLEFETPWGKSIGLETGNDSVLLEGEKKGYSVVVRKDPETGGVRIYARWDRGVDLTKAYETVREKDPESEWFLHASKKLLLNMASSKKMKPTKLTLAQIIGILKK